MIIFVCVKQALDWNASTKDFRIDPTTQEVVMSFARYRIDQFDEIALEVALQYKEQAGGEVRALTVGPTEADDVLRHATAMKADHATHVVRNGGEGSTAEILAAAIRHQGEGIILCGRTSSGSGSGQTGPALAEYLGLPFVSNIVHFEGKESEWLCRCETSYGYELLKLNSPFVASVTNAETNLPRKPGMKDVMRSHREKFEVLSAGVLCPSPSSAYQQMPRAVRRYVPVTSRACRRLDGGPPEQAKALAQYIRTVCTRSS